MHYGSFYDVATLQNKQKLTSSQHLHNMTPCSRCCDLRCWWVCGMRCCDEENRNLLN